MIKLNTIHEFTARISQDYRILTRPELERVRAFQNPLSDVMEPATIVAATAEEPVITSSYTCLDDHARYYDINSNTNRILLKHYHKDEYISISLDDYAPVSSARTRILAKKNLAS